MEDKLKKATGEEEKTRRSYEDALSNLSDVTPRYIEDMTQVHTFLFVVFSLYVLILFSRFQVFNKAQSFERDRINFFKQQALQMQEVLDVSSKPKWVFVYSEFTQYSRFSSSINLCDCGTFPVHRQIPSVKT